MFPLIALPTLIVGVSVGNPPIGEALSADELEGLVGAGGIIDAQLDAMVLAEIELSQITM